MKLIFQNILIFWEHIKKNEEYMTVATITLLSRSVITAGITSAESFQLIDYFLTKLSQTHRINDIILIRYQAIISFTELVYERNQRLQKHNIYVGECKQYIAAHIFKKIKVPDIAFSIGINSIYLERIFKESTGIISAITLHAKKSNVLRIYLSTPIDLLQRLVNI